MAFGVDVSGYRILNDDSFLGRDTSASASSSASSTATSTEAPLTADSKQPQPAGSAAQHALAVAQELNQKMLSLLGEFITEDGLVQYDKLKASAAFAEYCQATRKLKLV